MRRASGESRAARLLLVGGGHAQVAVLADFVRRGVPGGVRCLLVTPEPALRYSGMVPGWLAGQHGRDDGLVDLAGQGHGFDVHPRWELAAL